MLVETGSQRERRKSSVNEIGLCSKLSRVQAHLSSSSSQSSQWLARRPCVAMRPVLLVALVGAALIGVLVVLAHMGKQAFTSNQLGSDEFVVNNNNQTKSTTWLDSLLRPVARLFAQEGTDDDNLDSTYSGGDSSGRSMTSKYYRVPQGYLNYRRPVPQAEISNNKPEALVVPADERSQAVNDLSAANSIGSSQHVATNGDQQQATGLSSSSNRCRAMGGRCSFGSASEAMTTPSTPTVATSNEIRSVKCHNNKYDRIIAQKMSLNDISRPIIDSNGRFDNPFPTWKHPSVLDLAKFLTLESDDSNVPKDKAELEKELPVLKPDFKVNEAQRDNFRVTWIGHATLLIQVDGLNILTDPIFSDRASFTQYVGPKRFREPACEVKHLPPIHIVLISHNHYDHLDSNSVKQLNDRFGIDCRWIVPLGLGSYLQSMSIENYVELDWWRKDCYHVPPTGTGSNSKLINNSTVTNNNSPQTRSMVSSRSFSHTSSHSDTTSTSSHQQNRATRATNRMELDVYLTPTQHWSRRGVNDINKSLWGSYVIVNRDGSTFFFGGDTAYCSAFKEIGKVFGPFAGAAIPIGAYKPRWFLKYSHVDPQEAVQIHRDLKSMKSIAIHFGTFILSNENYKEPTRLLSEIMADLRVKEEVKEPFIALKHGESIEFCKHC